MLSNVTSVVSGLGCSHKCFLFRAHQRFKMLAPEVVAKDRNAKLPMDKIFNMPELEVNPFRDRICKVFSSSNDGNMTFEDFLDMMSVFSDKAPRSVKTEYAFQIFGKLTYSSFRGYCKVLVTAGIGIKKWQIRHIKYTTCSLHCMIVMI